MHSLVETSAIPLAATACDVAWVGCYPAHYVRRFHVEIEKSANYSIVFVYVRASSAITAERKYETGALPRNSVVLASGPAALTKVVRVLHRLDPAVVLTAGYRPAPIAGAALWAKSHGKVLSYWSDTNFANALSETAVVRTLRRLGMSAYLRLADCVIPMGTRNADFYRWCQVERLASAYMPYPHDPAPFRAASQRRSEVRERLGLANKFVVCYLGRLVRVKRVDRLIQAMTLLPSDVRARVLCRIVGDGPEKPALQAQVESGHLGDCVCFGDSIQSDAVPDEIAAADLFVLPSAIEPWALVVNEAMSTAVPVLAADSVGAAADLVVHGETGFIVKDGDPSVIAETIRQLEADRELARQLGKQAQRRVIEGGWTMEGALRGWRSFAAQFVTPSVTSEARAGSLLK